MKLQRRRFLHVAWVAATIPSLSRIAKAQSYPTRPVRIIVGFAPGGANDITARLIGQSLSGRFGQPFIIEHRPGAAGNIGTEAVVRAPADGYTLLIISPPNAINPTFYDKLNFNFIRDIAPVASINRVPIVMVVHPSVPIGSVPEFIAYAKANPGRINMASGGTGTPGHVAGELFKISTDVNMVHVPYRGGAPALTDLIAGQAQVMFVEMLSSVEYIRAGTLRALAVTTTTRSQVLPDIPTLSEFVPGFESSYWSGLGAPKNTPSDIIEKLNNEINASLADPGLKARLADMGATVVSGSPGDFAKFIAEETEKYRKVILAANIKAGPSP
jgi:tripartite-type tricarboxylate transporter receptor subunit TctC